MKPSRKLPTVLLILCTGFLLQHLNGVMAVQAQQVQVNAADPPAAEQGTVNLNVKVTGKGFKNGAQAKWFVTGTTNPGGVTVNSTTFVSTTEVTANITVSDTAVISNFDIQVLNSDGRGGKGTELFAVTAKGNQANSCPVQPPPPTGDTRCYAALPGCFDTSFGGGTGFVYTHHGNAAARYVSAVAVQPDGKIVTAGVARPSGIIDDVAVTRFNSDGSLDNLFGDADPLNPGFRLGYVVTSITTSSTLFTRAIALQNDGKIVVSGSYYSNRFIGFVVRYNANGTLDGTFGSGGRVTLDFGKRVTSPEYDLAIQADGKILIGGGRDGFSVARLLPNGSVDTSFGSGGLVVADPSGTQGGTSVSFSMTIQRVPAVTGEERIVVAGKSKISSGDNYDWTLMRLRSNGATDTSFGNGGVVKTPFFGYWDEIHAVTIDYSNRIVAAGQVSTANQDVCGAYVIDYAVVRYNENGTLDLSFGGGKQMVDFYGGRDEAAYGVSVQYDNKIVGLVNPSNIPVSDFGLVRFNIDGSRDSSFGPLGNGLVTTDFFGVTMGHSTLWCNQVTERS
jgi:uncharacterized delta-60 repeat protein